ncbi:hypothetical protein LZ30DRAFT_174504 [Colletotrichum cereale]|nr:hypothetical protein LZ30DRAFT_174504 [Colletotrichum cereale]
MCFPQLYPVLKSTASKSELMTTSTHPLHNCTHTYKAHTIPTKLTGQGIDHQDSTATYSVGCWRATASHCNVLPYVPFCLGEGEGYGHDVCLCFFWPCRLLQTQVTHAKQTRTVSLVGPGSQQTHAGRCLGFKIHAWAYGFRFIPYHILASPESRGGRLADRQIRFGSYTKGLVLIRVAEGVFWFNLSFFLPKRLVNEWRWVSRLTKIVDKDELQGIQRPAFALLTYTSCRVAFWFLCLLGRICRNIGVSTPPSLLRYE